MAGFALLSLNDIHLEKIINKLREESYYRLQLTCREVNEFIQNSPNISIHMDEELYPVWNEEKSCCLLQDETNGWIGIEANKGTRVTAIEPVLTGDNKAKQMEQIWDALKKNRITCEALSLPEEVAWSKEQCLSLINTVKAENVTINSSGSNRFEALLQVKIPLEHVTVHLNPDDVAIVVPQLLRKMESVEIQVEGGFNSRRGQPHDLFFAFLKIFFSEPFPNLLYFSFEAQWSVVPNVKRIKNELDGYKLNINKEEFTNVSIGFLDIETSLPEGYPTESFCRFAFFDVVSFQYYCSRPNPLKFLPISSKPKNM